MTNQINSLVFVILIGGKSTRFGSDKGIFEFLGKPLVSHQIELLSKFKYNICLVAHSQTQIDVYKKKINMPKNVFFLLDDTKKLTDTGLRAPIIGIYSSFKKLSELNYKKAFLISCDTPLINQEVVKLMLNQIKGYDCCIPRWENGYFEPLFAIYPVRDSLSIVKQNLSKKSYKLTNLLDKNWKINFISVENSIKPLDNKLLTFINLNGPNDVDNLLKLIK